MFAWVLGGTSEGRQLCELCASHGVPTVVSVASEYGGELVEDLRGVEVRVGKLNADDMTRLIAEGVACVLDATHPYAQNVSRNVRAVCENTGTPYFRVLRPETPFVGGNVVRVKTPEEAAAYLAAREGHALLTTGVNSLPAFTEIPDFKRRLSVRVLPDRQSLARCHELGFSTEQIIAMKGPFPRALNEALLQARGARFLVSKDGGDVGGAQDKADAAQNVGATLVLIERPPEPLGCPSGDIKAALRFANARLGRPEMPRPRFPIFLDLDSKRVVVFGGGRIAVRRVQTLLAYGAQVRVVAPELCGCMPNGVETTLRKYQNGDCDGAALVVAATDDKSVNAAIAAEAKALGIPISCASDAALGSFHFPGTFRDEAVSVGLTSGDCRYSKHLVRSLAMHWPTIRNVAQCSLRAERARTHDDTSESES